MARVVILGAGIAGHTAALHLKRRLQPGHQVVVISPNADWNWIPSNTWVGVGQMTAKQVTFPLRPIYQRKGIDFRQARAVAIHPEGDANSESPSVDIIYTDPARAGQEARLSYDYLINATGPKLNFAATPGLGPEANSLSVCTATHAEQAAAALDKVVAALKRGQRQTLVIGVGHGTCTCEGAAFEYTFNVEHELRARGVRDLAEVVYLTNEYDLGDFGVGGTTFEQKGYVTTSKIWTESLFRERNVRAILRAHVERVDPGLIHYEQLDGTKSTLAFDFAMLLPPFRGAGLKAYDRQGAEITAELFAPSGFLKVDADYATKPFGEWRAEDWPSTYQNPKFGNIFGVGIAFAPPHPISQPHFSPNGTAISPAPPRTGMPSGVMGRVVAQSIADRIQRGQAAPLHTASMASLGAACIASTGAGLLAGTAAALTMYPIVPDFVRYPASGRSLKETTGEIGLGAHWTKLMLHYLFIYKAKGRPGWFLIPE
ncbi:MAG: NAD(P)/FAD-dependent oxidoreductase [Thermoleophilia bacterium]